MFPAAVTSSSRTAPQQRIDAIYQEIRYRICTNRYPPETVLSEEVLARGYKVSRSPIRRVFSRLEHEALVEIKHGVGTVVTGIEPDQLADVYAVRLILAEAMGPTIETPFDPATRKFFVQCGQDFKALSVGDTMGFAEANIRFMMGLTGLSSNTVLRDLQRNLFFQTSRMWLLLLPQLPWEATIEGIVSETHEIAHRIDVGDSIGVGYTLRNNTFKGQQLLFSALRSN